MAGIMLCSDFPYKDVSVPTKFIDKYMPEANGEFVKVYLYLLRSLSAGTDFSISSIADIYNHTEKDIIRALKYWERQKLLKLDFNPDNTLAGIMVINIYTIDDDAEVDTGSASASATASAEKSMVNTPVVSRYIQTSVTGNSKAAPEERKEYTLDEIKTFRKNPDISELFFIVEAYLKHTLSSTDINTILYWFDELHFDTDLIEYLVEYCISKGHTSIRYMDKVALNWAESEITTVEQAKETVSVHSQIYYSVMKALGISGRNLVDSEMRFIKKWSNDFGFGTELIVLACQRTISATHQPSFEYTDSILTSWHKNQVKSSADVEKLDAAFSKTRKITIETTDKPATKRNRFTDINTRSYDFDQLERLLLNSSAQ